MDTSIKELDGKKVQVIRKIDTSRHDSHFQRRVNTMGGLYLVKNIKTGDQLTAYGFELGIV